jgi:hypothetical protein
MSDPRIHTSGSNALADSLCPGRHLAQVGLPDTKSEDAESGNRIHAALASSNESGEVRAGDLSVDERDVFDRCREDERKVVVQYFGANFAGVMKVFREERFWTRFTANGAQLAHSGAPDVVFRASNRALVIDYKTGRLDVAESPRNLQLRDYAVLARGKFVTVDEVATAVVQPWVTREPTICIYDKAALEKSAQEMFERVIKSNTPGQPRVPGEAQCKYCKAKRSCLEYQKWAVAVAPPAIRGIFEVPMVAWTPEQRGKVADAIGPLLKLTEDAKQFLKDGIKSDPAFVPGWTLSKPKVRETIADAQECFTRFLKLGGTQEQFMPAVKVQKGALKEALHEVTNTKGKALDGQLTALLEGNVERSETEPSLERVETEGK